MIQSRRQQRIFIIIGCTIGGMIFCACFGLAAVFEWSTFMARSLHSAIDRDDANGIEAALNERPDLVENSDKVRQTPLIQSVWQNKRIAVATLIRCGANVHARWRCARDWNTAYHWNALHCTGATGNSEIAELLFGAGVDINQKSEKGQTPLDIAIERRSANVEKFLRANGGKLGNELP